MTYGCIGEKLTHSFSKEIHSKIADYDYELLELAEDSLPELLTSPKFRAINVTIPYKEKVIPYLSYIDEGAQAIGAVNTVVNKGGKLYGYNTDFYGMSALISRLGVDISGKKVVILGTGGTSKTALAVATHLGAKEVFRVSRRSGEGVITYDDLYKLHTDAQVIINTTPVGMYPKNNGLCVEIDKFPALSLCVDAVYNPLRTPFILEAMKRGIPAEGGLYMLVAQAVRASEIFLDTVYDADTVDKIFKEILSQKENVVLIGMPASGKSTVGKLLAERLERPLIDTDELVVSEAKMQIVDIFSSLGEEKFRDMESLAAARAAKSTSSVIATGGGAILRQKNVDFLRQNGKLFFIDRPLEALVPTDSRPLSNSRASIEKRYRERYGIYCSTCDVKIDASCDAIGVCEKIIASLG